MRQFRTVLAVIGAVTVLVLAANTVALAATGNALILGRSNSAATQTTVKRTTLGPPLRLTAKSVGNAPFATNARGKVTNLNADKLDGLDATKLRTRSYVYTASIGSDLVNYVQVEVPVPAGQTYWMSYSVPTADLGPAASIQCYLRESFSPSGESRTGYSALGAGGSFGPALSGAGVVTRRLDGAVAVICEASGDTFAGSQFPIQIVATPTTVIGKATLSPITLP